MSRSTNRVPAGRSLYLRLAKWLSACITLVAIAAGVFSFVEAMDDAHDLQDDFLRQTALIVANQSNGNAYIASVNIDLDDELDDDESHLIIQRLDMAEKAYAASSPNLPDTLKNGLQTIQIGETGYRVMVRQLPSGQRIAVAQETKLRDEIARNSAIHTVLPLFMLIPTLVLLVIVIVYRALRPVSRLAKEVDMRSDSQLHPLPEQHLPSEVLPFVRAINRLLARVDQAMQAQRRFVADAAHELRSPMTALSLQAQRLAGAEMSDTAHDRVQTLQQGIERNRRLLDQLLAMARAQEPSIYQAQAVVLHDVFRQVLEDLMPLAEARHVDVGMTEGANGEEGHGVQVRAHAVEVATVIKNLVDNAIRYAPDGGRVDLSARVVQGSIILEVEDNGPGIPPGERARVLDAFYRVAGTEPSGSGLGLSIAKAIVDRWGGQIELLDAVHFPTGLLVRIRLPAQLRG